MVPVKHEQQQLTENSRSRLLRKVQIRALISALLLTNAKKKPIRVTSRLPPERPRRVRPLQHQPRQEPLLLGRMGYVTGCRCGPVAGTPSPVRRPAWCCGRGSVPAAAPAPASAESAGGEGAASPTGAGTLWAQRSHKCLISARKDRETAHHTHTHTHGAFRGITPCSLCSLSSSLVRDTVPFPSHSALVRRSSAWLHIRYLQVTQHKITTPAEGKRGENGSETEPLDPL